MFNSNGNGRCIPVPEAPCPSGKEFALCKNCTTDPILKEQYCYACIPGYVINENNECIPELGACPVV